MHEMKEKEEGSHVGKRGGVVNDEEIVFGCTINHIELHIKV